MNELHNEFPHLPLASAEGAGEEVKSPGKKDKPIAAYQRIQNAIRMRIEVGQLLAGDMVESERNLAKIHRVSLMTARHALVELERKGIVVRHQGRGTFVAPAIEKKLCRCGALLSGYR